MAGNGPPPKPAVRRQRRNERTSTERAGVGLVALAGGKPDEPAPPAGLLKLTRDAWVRFWGSPLANLLTTADHPALERLFTLYDERTRAYRGLRRDGRLIEGEKGLSLNPLAGYLKACDSEIRQMEDRFGLTPMARLRLGVQLGEAAKSLEEMNRSLDDDPDEQPAEDVDPRVRVVEPAASSGGRIVAADAGPGGVPLD